MIEISLEDERWLVLGEPEDWAARACEAAFRIAGGKPAPVSLLLGDDAMICTLNQQWRDKDKATNVLSFPSPPAFREQILGDVALAFETVMREAEQEGKSFESHAMHLLIHGVLHLQGYDHETEAEALIMEELERKALASLSIGDPYLDRD